MPKLGLTMTEGTIAEWLAADGTEVAAGAVVMMIETDKVEAEVESPAAGLVRHTHVVGETLEPGEIVGYVLAAGEDLPAGASAPAAPSAPADSPAPQAAAPAAPPVPAEVAPAEQSVVAQAATGEGGRLLISPNARRVAAEMAVEVSSLTGTGPGGRITSEDVRAAIPSGRGIGGRVLASPNARRVAAELGIDVAAVAGTGPGGRVTSEDVRGHGADTLGVGRPKAGVGSTVSSPAPGTVAPAPASDRFVPFAATKAAERLGIDISAVSGSGPGGRVSRQDVYAFARQNGGVSKASSPAVAASGPQAGDIVPFKGMRGVIAERMHSSLQEMAQLTLAMDVDMDRVVELREQLKEIGADELGRVPGYTDFVIAAVARALQQHPGANAQAGENGIELLHDINVGMAVAVPDGLVVPVVQGADQLGVVDLAGETARLATAARDKTLTLDEMEGGTFSVTALGMYGVDMFTPVINPPNAGILGVGRIRDDVAWDGDRPTRVQRMTLSLTWDHRVLDGAPAAEFAQSIKALLEQPLRLLG